MKPQSNILKRVVIDKREEHVLVCEELSKYYGKSLYWLPYKFPIQRIKEEFLRLEKDGDHDFSHLMQQLQSHN